MKENVNLIDDSFIKQNLMGPNSYRIINEMAQDLKITNGMRILDLGCGKGLTSIYLAKNFDVQVYAVDLWITATENYERFKSVNLDSKIIPINCDAQNLPFANDFFDLAISIDAYHYFGINKGFLSKQITPLVKKGGLIAIGVPGLKNEFTNGIPEEMKPFWQDDFNFHSCQWWENLWNQEESISINRCYELTCYKEAWNDWLSCNNKHAISDIEMMKAENGKYFNLVSINGTVK